MDSNQGAPDRPLSPIWTAFQAGSGLLIVLALLAYTLAPEVAAYLREPAAEPAPSGVFRFDMPGPEELGYDRLSGPLVLLVCDREDLSAVFGGVMNEFYVLFKMNRDQQQIAQMLSASGFGPLREARLYRSRCYESRTEMGVWS